MAQFHVLVLEPKDVTSFPLSPAYASISQQHGSNYYDSGFVKLAKGEQFALNLQYEKTTDTLVAPPQGIQPVVPLDENTPGRVSLNNSLPYIIGGLGVVMIVGGIAYYWQAGRTSSKRSRRRSHAHEEREENDGMHIVRNAAHAPGIVIVFAGYAVRACANRKSKSD